jgi:hypothetical protein
MANNYHNSNPRATNLRAGRLAVVRSCHSTQTRYFPKAAALVVGDDGSCWTPDRPIPRDAQPSAMRALERHAQHAASLGVYAPTPEGKRAA